ncbi:MAG: glycosyltransferase, partial [Acidimicrobiales bacterium]
MSRFAIIGARGFPSHYSGFETLVRHLAPHLVEEGHEVTVYGRTEGRPTVSVREGVTVREVRCLDGKSTSTLTYGHTASRDLRQRGFDAALVLNVALGYYLGRLRRSNVPTCVNVD